MDFNFLPSPPNLPFFSLKKHISPLFFWFVYGFAIACLSQIAILFLSQINPSLAGKITGVSIFKVNISLDNQVNVHVLLLN